VGIDALLADYGHRLVCVNLEYNTVGHGSHYSLEQSLQTSGGPTAMPIEATVEIQDIGSWRSEARGKNVIPWSFFFSSVHALFEHPSLLLFCGHIQRLATPS